MLQEQLDEQEEIKKQNG